MPKGKQRRLVTFTIGKAIIFQVEFYATANYNRLKRAAIKKFLNQKDIKMFEVPFTLESVGIKRTPQKYQYYEREKKINHA